VKHDEQFTNTIPYVSHASDDLDKQMIELKKLREKVRQADARRRKQLAVDDVTPETR
jgi:hypothetical protein